MPSLSFTKSGKDEEAIAVVRGGEFDGEILYLNSEDGKRPTRFAKEVDTLALGKKLSFLKPAERTKTIVKIQEALAKGIAPEALLGVSEAIRDVYRDIKSADEQQTEVELPSAEGQFQMIPTADPTKRQVFYVAGMSGSGKSWFARGVAENYKKLYPHRQVYLISELSQDETLDGSKIAKPKRISLQSLIDDPVSNEELRNMLRESLVIFDDWDCLAQPFYKLVHSLIESICIQGRHEVISCLILSHHLTNYKSTKLMLGEADFLVLYPLATSTKALTYVAENYGNVDKATIPRFKRLGRWVCIKKTYPSFVVSPQNAFLLHQK